MSDEISTHWYKVLINLYKMYNYYDNRACGYKWYAILLRLDGMVLGSGLVWNGLGVACVEPCDP
jgi:hypothetical protein